MRHSTSRSSAPASDERILLAVTGLSPQVLTETLYALAVASEERFVPTHVHLVTSAEGAERARLSLLGGAPGWFERFCSDYAMPPIAFDESTIHVLTDAEGRALADIRCPADNECAANSLTEHVRALTAEAKSTLHVSIAGGRKTMGFYAGYALSLFGRPQDRLSHVLVPAPYESHPEFFYPTPYTRIIHTPPPDSRPLDTRTASVTLADIPFVRLRHGLPERLLDGAATFSETVGEVQMRLGPPALVVDPAHGRIQAGGHRLSLPPADLAFYAWVTRRHVDGAPALTCPNDGAAEPGYAREYLAEYQRVIGKLGDDDRTRARLEGGMSKQFFLERKSRLHRRLRDALGMSAGPYLIAGSGRRPMRYGLALGPDRVRLGDIAPPCTRQPARPAADSEITAW